LKTASIQRSDAKVELNSRISAKSGNNVNVSQATTAGNKMNSKSKPTANPTAESTCGDSNSLSDEDDSVERATILKSPPKGAQRLSSAVSHFGYIFMPIFLLTAL
jgi:hypothetical protein